MPMLAKFLPLERESYYREVGQPNPLRWQLYFQREGELIPQTSLFKCKDFFNDIVGWYHGKTGEVYGMDTTTMQLNDYGVFVRLFFLKKGFRHNIETVVNPLLQEKLLFVDVQEGEALTLLPRELFNNTFIISKVSHLIRLCNIDKEVSSFEELQQNHPFEDCTQLIPSLTLPEKYKVFWWFAGEGYNSLGSVFNMIWLHNNGYKSWATATKGEVQ